MDSRFRGTTFGFNSAFFSNLIDTHALFSPKLPFFLTITNILVSESTENNLAANRIKGVRNLNFFKRKSVPYIFLISILEKLKSDARDCHFFSSKLE